MRILRVVRVSLHPLRSLFSLLSLALLIGALAGVCGCQSPPEDGESADPTAEEAGGGELSIRKPCSSSSLCGSDGVCTTEQGVCNPPPGCDPGSVCPAVCYGTCQPPRVIPGRCQTDADCRTFSDYCTGCDCRALAAGQKPPVCSDQGVQCYVDPCRDQEAFCSAGRCQVRRAGESIE
jgi:hypothetical protein